MAKPFTIKLFMPSGNANELKLIEKMNWTGLGMEISRTAWLTHRKREELQQAGIYILAGYDDGSGRFLYKSIAYKAMVQ